MRAELLALAAGLAQRGEPFVVATVVRREPPSSARVGDTALITADGGFHGWLGGSCTQPTVRREAVHAMVDGVPRLVALSPEPERDRRPGVLALPMTCHSGGSVDIYIEPHLPAPRLVVFGISPVARALAALASVMGYAVDAIDPEAERAGFPEGARVMARVEPSAHPHGEVRSAVPPRAAVVATMGQWDEEAIRAALALAPTYLGVVASARRFEEMRRFLRETGVEAAALERVRSPAGLDIGARTPEEIALSVLAEIVRAHRVAPDVVAPGAVDVVDAAPPPAEAIDPVCGMPVATAGASHVVELDGRTWYFCCPGCRGRFEREPARWIDAPGALPARGPA